MSAASAEAASCRFWSISDTTWSAESPRVVVGHARRNSVQVLISPCFTPLFPLEVEFDVETPNPPSYSVDLGLCIPRKTQADKKEHQKGK
jgi:hypothetical protein